MKASDFVRFIQEWGLSEWVVYAVSSSAVGVSSAYFEVTQACGVLENVKVLAARDIDNEMADEVVVVQMKNCAWTIIIQSLCVGIDEDVMAQAQQRAVVLSRKMETKALVFMGEHTSGAMAVSVYERGKQLEEVGWDEQGEDADGYFRALGIDFPVCYPCREGEAAWVAVLKPEVDHILCADLIVKAAI